MSVTEDELHRAYSGHPLDIHGDVRELREAVDELALELRRVRQLVELALAELGVDPDDGARP